MNGRDSYIDYIQHNQEKERNYFIKIGYNVYIRADDLCLLIKKKILKKTED